MSKIELSRRLLLQKAAVAAGAATALGMSAHSAVAQPAKSLPQVAGYQTEPRGSQRCGNCQHFQPPAACKVVGGRISPQGWCRLYFAK